MRYEGNWPRNVSKDAKYSVVSGERDELRIRLYYELGGRETALLSTTLHPDLADMVNQVKEEFGSGPKGPFYINEYGHVIVPAGYPTVYYFAGRYEERLEFEFEGAIISADPPKGITPGDDWSGPHVGIPYVLTADGSDIYYKMESRPNVEKQVVLSDAVGSQRAGELARRLGRHKESQGGRVYINEAGQFFMPVSGREGLRYVYAGALGDDPWYPEPEVPDGW
jgi:hypothetical protein